MGKPNCWEFKHCGRQPGGRLAGELGICPASTYKDLHAAHGGMNAGRACWVVAGTFCGGVVQGTAAQKQHNCWVCDFFQAVKREETASPMGFSATLLGMKRVLERS
jgi:hypothetical protein